MCQVVCNIEPSGKDGIDSVLKGHVFLKNCLANDWMSHLLVICHSLTSANQNNGEEPVGKVKLFPSE